MAAGAADLVDHILPVVANYRQWTLSFPRWLRIRLLRDKALVSEVMTVFVRVVSAYDRRRARHRGIAGGQTGAVTAIQRVGSFANAYVHFHTLVPEGVWHERPDGSLGFHALPPPTDEDIEQITARIVGKIRRLLESRDGDPVADEPDALAHAQAEAVQLPMSLAEPVPRTSGSRRRCGFIDGFRSMPTPWSSDPRIGDEREYAQRITAARALGDLVAEHPAQQRGPIEPASEPHRGHRGGWSCGRGAGLGRERGRRHDAGTPDVGRGAVHTVRPHTLLARIRTPSARPALFSTGQAALQPQEPHRPANPPHGASL